MPDQYKKPPSIDNLKAPVQLRLADALPEGISQHLEESLQNVKQAGEYLRCAKELLDLQEVQNQELRRQLKAEKIWRNVLTKIPVGATLKLMLEHAQLILINDTRVIVNLPSQRLLTRAQEDRHVLQAAFEKVYGHQVKVRLLLSNKDTKANFLQEDF